MKHSPVFLFCIFENKFVIFKGADIFFACGEFSFKHLFRKLILNLLLNRTAERSCTVNRVKARLADFRYGILRKFKLKIKLFNSL